MSWDTRDRRACIHFSRLRCPPQPRLQPLPPSLPPSLPPRSRQGDVRYLLQSVEPRNEASVRDPPAPPPAAHSSQPRTTVHNRVRRKPLKQPNKTRTRETLSWRGHRSDTQKNPPGNTESRVNILSHVCYMPLPGTREKTNGSKRMNEAVEHAHHPWLPWEPGTSQPQAQSLHGPRGPRRRPHPSSDHAWHHVEERDKLPGGTLALGGERETSPEKQSLQSAQGSAATACDCGDTPTIQCHVGGRHGSSLPRAPFSTWGLSW